MKSISRGFFRSVPCIAAGLLLLGQAAPAAADEAPTVEQIVEKANCVAFYQGNDNTAEVTMAAAVSVRSVSRRRRMAAL